jgi:hypothetical protein
MPHIIILEEWLDLLNQTNVYSHVIKDKLDGNEFHGQDVTTAQNLQSNLTSLIGSINTSHRTALDGLIADQEGLLGI